MQADAYRRLLMCTDTRSRKYHLAEQVLNGLNATIILSKQQHNTPTHQVRQQTLTEAYLCWCEPTNEEKTQNHLAEQVLN
jgi:hypothetical protein